MIKRLRARRPSAAMIIAVIALIAALGGTAIAGGVLTTKKFKNQAVRGPLSYVNTAVNLPALTRGDGMKVAAVCPKGQHPVGGGAVVADEEAGFVNDSYPTVSGWTATLFNFTSLNTTATVTAICATVKKVSGAPPSS